MRCRCNGSHSRDSPSDRHGRRLLDSSRQRPCCEPPTGTPQWESLPASTLRGISVHSLCLLHISHALGCTSSYNTMVQAWWGNRIYLLSPHHALSLRQLSKPTSARYWQSQNLLLQSLAYPMCTYWLSLLIRLTTTFTMTSFSSVRLSAIINVRATRVLSAMRFLPSAEYR